jgi:hypothetical protein
MGGKGGYFQKLSQGSETSDMTSEGLGEMSEGDVHPKISAHVHGGPSRGSSVRRPRSEDPHWRERIFKSFRLVLYRTLAQCFVSLTNLGVLPDYMCYPLCSVASILQRKLG